MIGYLLLFSFSPWYISTRFNRRWRVPLALRDERLFVELSECVGVAVYQACLA